jgi:glycosyltransferase involved in cell wall biosynthesis
MASHNSNVVTYVAQVPKPLFVSVIVITRNNNKTIRECIESLLGQTYPKERLELIFVDGHSDDGTDEIIKEYSTRYSLLNLYYENKGKMGYARNLGVSKSKGDILAFTDADAVLPDTWLEKLIHVFIDRDIIAVGGMDILVSDGQNDRIIDSWRRLKKTTGTKAIPCIKTVNLAIRREDLLSCGAFDPTLSHWDEAEMLARLQSKRGEGQILYDPEILVYHKRAGPGGIRSRIRKTFRKSVIGTPVLARNHMIKIATANLASPIGIAFLFIPVCLVSSALLLLSIALGILIKMIVLCFSLYVVLISVFVFSMYRRAHFFNFRIPLLLTVDFVVRFFGTLLGLARLLYEFVTKSHKAFSGESSSRNAGTG